eukprot:Lankesteria_metandrocarpae@DN1559_c0_g1_i1.p1
MDDVIHILSSDGNCTSDLYCISDPEGSISPSRSVADRFLASTVNNTSNSSTMNQPSPATRLEHFDDYANPLLDGNDDAGTDYSNKMSVLVDGTTGTETADQQIDRRSSTAADSSSTA